MFWNRDDMVSRAKKINKVLGSLGISEHSQTGREIRGVAALELLGEEHPTIEKYSKATFLKTVSNDEVKRLLMLLREEGLLNKKGAVLIEGQEEKK